ncbi:MAG: IclR family transcriptional regulator [Microbacterium sp.]
MDENPTHDPQAPRVPALRHGIAILRHLASSPTPISAGAIVRRLGIPRSSTYQLLKVLIDEGLVVHIPEAQGYALGVGVFELGSAYVRHQPVENLARPLITKLVAQIGQTVHLGILHAHEALYLLKEQPPRPAPLVTEVGVRLPAHLTATGRALLSGLPGDQVTALFASPGMFTDRTGVGPHTLRQLKALLAVERRQGYSLESSSVTEGVTCIASASLDHNDFPVASIATSFHTASVPEEQWPSLTAQVIRTANALTVRLGGTAVHPPPDGEQDGYA